MTDMIYCGTIPQGVLLLNDGRKIAYPYGQAFYNDGPNDVPAAAIGLNEFAAYDLGALAAKLEGYKREGYIGANRLIKELKKGIRARDFCFLEGLKPNTHMPMYISQAKDGRYILTLPGTERRIAVDGKHHITFYAVGLKSEEDPFPLHLEAIAGRELVADEKRIAALARNLTVIANEEAKNVLSFEARR